MSSINIDGDKNTLSFASKAKSMQRLGALLRLKGFEVCASKCDYAAATYWLASEFQARGNDIQACEITQQLRAPISWAPGGGEPVFAAAALRVTKGLASAPGGDGAGQNAGGRKMSMWM